MTRAATAEHFRIWSQILAGSAHALHLIGQLDQALECELQAIECAAMWREYSQ